MIRSISDTNNDNLRIVVENGLNNIYIECDEVDYSFTKEQSKKIRKALKRAERIIEDRS